MGHIHHIARENVHIRRRTAALTWCLKKVSPLFSIYYQCWSFSCVSVETPCSVLCVSGFYACC